ncbi:non-canonical purine NTP pyrophosphatase [Synergistales bacterium]|nr:non-canonical purine NTP pyrophosphatase [Synergistales bacterium]
MFDVILLATTNRGKYREFSEILTGVLARKLLFAPDAAPLDVEENGATYASNAVLKARAWAAASGLPALADDSGLEVEALGWRPGLFSARAAAGADSDRNRWLLSELYEKAARRASFVADVALAMPEWTLVCEGVCDGRISEAEAGEGGFGYDPLFIPDGFNISFAELPMEIKNKISHRAKAVKALLDSLDSLDSLGKWTAP